MRQYRHGRWNIATNIRGIVVATVLTCRAAIAQDAVPDHQWYQGMTAEAMRQLSMPPVELAPVEVQGDAIIADIRVQPWFEGNSLDFVLTLPPGDITSATLVPLEISGDPDTDAAGAVTTAAGLMREIPANARHLGYVRGNRLVKVQSTVHVPGIPGKRLQAARVMISYSAELEPLPAVENDPPGGPIEDPFLNMLEKLVANPADLRRFARPLVDAPPPADDALVPIGGYSDAISRFEVMEEGFVEFTGADLAAAGVDLAGIEVSRVSVWSDDLQQPIHVSGLAEHDRPVDPSDSFRIYARDNDSTYTVTRNYWVRVLDEPAIPMQVSAGGAAVPSTADQDAYFWAQHVAEKDIPPVLTKNDQFLTILGFRWVWWTWTPLAGNDEALPGARDYDTSGSVRFNLAGLAEQENIDAPVTMHFYAHRWNMNSAPVPFRVELNDQFVDRIIVSEPAALEHTVLVPADLLKTSDNRLVLVPEVEGAASQLPELCFDRMEISYPRTYAMTSNTLEFFPPSAAGGNIAIKTGDIGSSNVLIADVSGDVPRLIAGNSGPAGDTFYLHTEGPESRRYLAFTPDAIRRAELKPAVRTEDLVTGDNKADLLVIAWPDFIEDLQPWVDKKMAKGHAVKVVDVFDIYDQFGYGHESPHAIRAFLRHAAIHWQGSSMGPAASAVVLVGDSTSAYRGEFRNEVINYVPSMRLNLTGDPFASDQWFVSYCGDDAFADALIGRFSVNNRGDLHTLIQKQVDYEDASASGPWQNTLGFVADHTEFSETVERVMKQVVPPRYFLDRIMMSELPWVDNYYFPKEIADARKAKVSTEATGRIRDMFNNGAAVVTYFGHGSPNIWSNERMWFGGDSPNSDNLLLTNRDKLSIVINMTCNSGAIDYPQPRWNVAISEDFMRVANGGAVACFVPSGPGLTVQHERLMMEVGRLLFSGDNELPLGHTLHLALWRYLAGGNAPELARMYILLGDPLMMPRLARPVDDAQDQRNRAANWPGTIALPPDVAGNPQGGSYQFISYNGAIEPQPIGTFTSATVALPLPQAADETAWVLAVAAPDDAATTSVESTYVPVSTLAGFQVVQWSQADGADQDATTTLEFHLKNSNPIPVRDVRVQVFSAESDQLLAESDSTNVSGFGETRLKADLHAPPGLTPLQVRLADARAVHDLDTGTPVAVVGLRPDEMRESVPPAIVDPRSVSVRYRKADNGVAATVSAQVHVLAREALSNLRMGLEDATGLVVQDSIITVPAVRPGENVRVSLSLMMSPEAPSQTYSIRFDPSGFYPEFARFPTESVELGRIHFADIALGAVTPSDKLPTDGETVFFDVEVGNQGGALAEGVRVEGFLHTTQTEPLKLESQVKVEHPLLTLAPGTTEIVRLRWDPFQNAGENKLHFSAHSIYEMPDRTLDNNTRELTLIARTKARLRRLRAGVLPLTEDDLRARQVRFMGRVQNEGETEARGLRVRFYSSARMTEEEFLGEEELERIEPGETRDVIFTYKPKPGEEDRPINISFEIVYKGSRQRVPMD